MLKPVDAGHCNGVPGEKALHLFDQRADFAAIGSDQHHVAWPPIAEFRRQAQGQAEGKATSGNSPAVARSSARLNARRPSANQQGLQRAWLVDRHDAVQPLPHPQIGQRDAIGAHCDRQASAVGGFEQRLPVRRH